MKNGSNIEKEDTNGEISCPPERDKNIWKIHPRVYLTPNNQGIAICPYCSTKYTDF